MEINFVKLNLTKI